MHFFSYPYNFKLMKVINTIFQSLWKLKFSYIKSWTDRAQRTGLKPYIAINLGLSPARCNFRRDEWDMLQCRGEYYYYTMALIRGGLLRKREKIIKGSMCTPLVLLPILLCYHYWSTCSASCTLFTIQSCWRFFNSELSKYKNMSSVSATRLMIFFFFTGFELHITRHCTSLSGAVGNAWVRDIAVCDKHRYLPAELIRNWLRRQKS